MARRALPSSPLTGGRRRVRRHRPVVPLALATAAATALTVAMLTLS